MTFGHSMLEHWLLDPACLYLNHGTVGATPRRVLLKQQALRDEMERQPSRFMLRELNGEQPMPWRAVSRLREASDQVAAFVGARPDDLVFVPNVTTGLNAVIGSRPARTGRRDGDHRSRRTGRSRSRPPPSASAPARRSGPFTSTYPIRDAGRRRRADSPRHSRRARSSSSSITSRRRPRSCCRWPTIAAACRARGVPVLVDGAHVPGARALDIPSLGVDWYAANLHKWAHAPRGCGILWAAPERQSILRIPIVSWGHRKGFRAEFEHTATADPTSFLAAPEGIALLREWDFDACVEYMHDLAVGGRAHPDRPLAARRSRSRATWSARWSRCRCRERAGATDDDATRLRLALLVDDRIEVQLHAWRGRLWTRVSAQVYNDRSDMERLAEAVARRL